MQYQIFSTGDQIWTSKRFGQRVTVKMISHDGMVWEEGDEQPFRRLQGIEKYVHAVQTFLVQSILKVLN